MPPIDIRTATADDAEAIAIVHVAAWKVGYRGLMPDEVLDALTVEMRSTRWKANLAAPAEDVSTLLAFVDGLCVGFVSHGPARGEGTAPDTREIWALYAHPNVWGTGVGRAMLLRVDEEMRAQGATRSMLWVLTGNARARRFYEAGGYVPDGATKVVEEPDMTLHETRYRKMLV